MFPEEEEAAVRFKRNKPLPFTAPTRSRGGHDISRTNRLSGNGQRVLSKGETNKTIERTAA